MKDFDIDRGTLRVAGVEVFGETFAGQEARMVDTLNQLLRKRMANLAPNDERNDRFLRLSRMNWAAGFDLDRAKQLVENMRGGVLPGEFEYAIGPCILKTSEDEGIPFEDEGDLGVYRIDNLLETV